MTRSDSFPYIARTKPKLLTWFAGGVCWLTIAATIYRTTSLAAPAEDEDAPVEFHGPPARPGYPDAFSIGYVLRKKAVSPNQQLGVIFPSRSFEDRADFVIDLKGSRILGRLEVEEPYFEGKNRGGLTVHWSPDSSAALVENGGRWAPRDLVLIELKNGKISRQTQLVDQVEKMFIPMIAKAEHSRPSETGIGEWDIARVSWAARNRLQIKCNGMTNPKGFAQESQWEGTLVAVWDLARQKFVEQKVTQTSFRPAGKEEE